MVKISEAQVRDALMRAGYSPSAAARLLTISRNTMYRLMRKYGIVITRSTVKVLDAEH